MRLLSVLLLAFIGVNCQQWSIEQAKEWYAKQGWLAGCNFIPSTAENTIEMWQNETFDPKTIDVELGYAESIGFNIVRVFLHYLVWLDNPIEFKQRLDTYLNIAISHKIKTMFVFFDDVWNGYPYLGRQEPPIPGVHNSRWVQCPGQDEVTNTTLFPVFQNYVQDILKTFGQDDRVSMWDMYNEPGNSNHELDTLILLELIFNWARKINVSQPLTSGLWGYTDDIKQTNVFQINNSDIITFHCYSGLDYFESLYQSILNEINDRPCVCSEYMARLADSHFETHMPYMKSQNVGAINWGLVGGKTQTIYPWWSIPYAPYPTIWFHDIFYKDGRPFNSSETDLIRNLTARN